MNLPSLSTLSILLDLALPPRRTERIVRTISAGTLSMLASPQGTLPYHEPRVTALIWELKYKRSAEALRLAGGFLAEQALGIAEESLAKPTLVPVPMHALRKKERGYNQTELLCEAMMKATPDSFSYAPDSLVRVRHTRPQQGLPRHRRIKNILGAIEVSRAEEILGKLCIVVDDVSTTGATAHETKRVLLDGGAKEVYILTLAHS